VVTYDVVIGVANPEIKLFPGMTANVIRIKLPFIVVGVLERKGQSPTGQDQDDVVLIPISTAKRNGHC
jgi:hypothetical protein